MPITIRPLLVALFTNGLAEAQIRKPLFGPAHHDLAEGVAVGAHCFRMSATLGLGLRETPRTFQRFLGHQGSDDDFVAYVRQLAEHRFDLIRSVNHPLLWPKGEQLLATASIGSMYIYSEVAALQARSPVLGQPPKLSLGQYVTAAWKPEKAKAEVERWGFDPLSFLRGKKMSPQEAHETWDAAVAEGLAFGRTNPSNVAYAAMEREYSLIPDPSFADADDFIGKHTTGVSLELLNRDRTIFDGLPQSEFQALGWG